MTQKPNTVYIFITLLVPLLNEGKECRVAGSCLLHGPCAYCGSGLCCKKNYPFCQDCTGRGCDGKMGNALYHVCSANLNNAGTEMNFNIFHRFWLNTC